MAFVTARQCDRCKLVEQDQPGDIDSTTGWAEPKFIANEAVLPVKVKRVSAE